MQLQRRWHIPKLFVLYLLCTWLALPIGAGEGTPRTTQKREGYTINGLPQHEYYMDVVYEHGILKPLQFGGTVGYLLEPKGEIDPQRRWVWISPMWLALRSGDAPSDIRNRYYVESLLSAGFHVVGLDVGTTCGSRAGAELYQRFYEEKLIKEYRLNPKARLLGQSNGGLIAYAWAFRHPEHVDRILGILPATDIRSWPGLEKVAGKGRITPAGLAYPVDSTEELEKRLKEFNPIDNLEPLAKAGVKIFHIHGDKDDLVPMNANSEELMRRYRELGGQANLEVLKGMGHGGLPFRESKSALHFLLE